MAAKASAKSSRKEPVAARQRRDRQAQAVGCASRRTASEAALARGARRRCSRSASRRRTRTSSRPTATASICRGFTTTARSKASVYTGQRAQGGDRSGSAPLVDRLEPAADLRGDPPAPRGARVRPRLRDEEAPAGQPRRREEDLPDPPSGGGGHQDGQVPQGHPPAPPVLPRVRAARQDRLQGPADHRLAERSRDAEDAERASASPPARTTISSASSRSRPTAARSRACS